MTTQEFIKELKEAIIIKLVTKGKNKKHQYFTFKINLPINLFDLFTGNKYEVTDNFQYSFAEYFFEFGYELTLTIAKNGKAMNFQARLLDEYTFDETISLFTPLILQ